MTSWSPRGFIKNEFIPSPEKVLRQKYFKKKIKTGTKISLGTGGSIKDIENTKGTKGILQKDYLYKKYLNSCKSYKTSPGLFEFLEEGNIVPFDKKDNTILFNRKFNVTLGKSAMELMQEWLDSEFPKPIKTKLLKKICWYRVILLWIFLNKILNFSI